MIRYASDTKTEMEQSVLQSVYIHVDLLKFVYQKATIGFHIDFQTP